MAGAKGPTPERAKRMEKVMNMRILGTPFATIAERLDIGVSQAHRDFKEAIHNTYAPATREYIAMQNERLERLLQASLTDALQNSTDLDTREKNIKYRAVDSCAKLIEQMNRLNGISMDQNKEVMDHAIESLKASFALMDDTAADLLEEEGD